MRLLVIERDSTRSTALRNRLDSCGAQVVDDAIGVDAGRSLARSTAYDAILIGQPGDVAALEACTLLGTDEALRGRPLLVIQGQPSASARGLAVARGAIDLLAQEGP